MASSTTSSFLISHLSTINVSNFVSSKLRGDKISNNYSSWKEQMLCLIESQDLLQFIEGKIDDGKRTDRLVKGWILGALDDAVLKNVANLTTATDVWLKLEKMFSDPDQVPQAAGEEWHQYSPLYKATLNGNWNETKEILEQDPNAMEAKLNSNLQTALHIAVGTGDQAIDFVKKLVDFMPNNLLGLKDKLGYTALHVAARTGNTKAAKILVDRWPDLLHEPNNDGDFPVHASALSGQIKTLEYFIYQTKDESPYLGETSGIKLLCILIDARILGVALHLAEKYPYLATVKLKDGNCALKRIALKKSAFPRDPIIRWFYIDREGRTTTNTGDIEGSINDPSPRPKSLYDLFLYMVYVFISVFFSGRCYPNPFLVKQIHKQAMKLVKSLCKNMESLDYSQASAIYEDAILTAASLGIHEIIKEIVATFPAAVYTRHIYTKQSIFHVAAENRQRQVFHLINQTPNLKHQMLDMTDFYGNTVLHLAAKLGSRQKRKLNHVTGAALQMQREILWFYEIGSFLRPYFPKKNSDGKTAWMVFEEEHASLKAQGEKWVKDTAQACSVVAGLIATVTFAAAITVPGGIDSNNTDINKKLFPLFSDKSAFKTFTWFNIISFFTSITSLFLFLSTNISLYAEERFLSILPLKLTLNLFILFISVISMMGAFIAAINLLLNDRTTIIVFPVLLLFPMYLFLAEYIPDTANLVKAIISFKSDKKN